MGGEYKRPDDEDLGEVIDVTSLGKGLEIKRRSKMELNHPKAEWLLKQAEFPGDRNLTSAHVTHLVNAMQRGTFLPELVTLITCKLGKTVYRMNGQHTAWARLEMPKKWPCKVELLEYEAKDLEDVRTLYASIDRNKGRTRANVTDAYLRDSGQLNGVSAGLLKKLPAGFALYKWENRKVRAFHDGDDIAHLLVTEDLTTAKRVCKFLENCSQSEQKHMFKPPVIAALFATFEHSVTPANEFWTPVAEGTGIKKKNDPRNRLRTKLQRSLNLKGDQRPSPEHIFRACLVAWNAWREGQELKNFRIDETGERPEVKK